MIPTFMRKGRSRKAGKSKEWNPATFYIVIFTLIGSQAIRMLTLKNDYAAYSRTTDAKIELLREVIERVKKGEKVDVEKLLGTGDEAKEREWEEGTLHLLSRNVLATNITLLVLREIEQEDTLWQEKQKSAQKAAQKATDEKPPAQKSEGKESVVPSTASADEETMKKTQSTRKLNFF